MATAQMDTVIRHLRQAVLRQDTAGRTDGQLLASFIDQKDEAAFEALVRRHGPMVLSVCRRVVRHHQDAEDAFQATFLVLARKASSIRPRAMVANWLHGVAYRTAMKAKSMTAKRQGREKQVADLPEPETVQQDQWLDLQPLLDQELNGLPEKYRLPILLCDLEGKTIKDAAQLLGWPHGTLAGRLARGRKLLAKRVTSRGVVLSVSSLASAMSQNVVSAGVPTSLMSSTVKVASSLAAGRAAAVVFSVKVATLVEGVLKNMLLNKLKTVTTVLLVVASALFGFGGGLLKYQTAVAEQTNPQAERPKPETRKAASEEERTPQEMSERPMIKPPQSDVDKLRDYRWNAIYAEQDGKPVSHEKTSMFFHDGLVRIQTNGNYPGDHSYKLDSTKSPKTLVIDSSVESSGTYVLDGDILVYRFAIEYLGENGQVHQTFLRVFKREPLPMKIQENKR